MKRAFVIVIDACGAGELPDSADYGDAGTNTLGHVAEAAGGLDLPVLQGSGSATSCRWSASPPSPEPRRPRPAAPARPGQGHDHRPLGADGRRHAACRCAPTPTASRTRSSSSCIDAHRPRHPLQPALQRHRGDRRLRRAAPRDRQPDRLHVGRLGAADRRARRRGAARRAVRGRARRRARSCPASTPSAA